MVVAVTLCVTVGWSLGRGVGDDLPRTAQVTRLKQSSPTLIKRITSLPFESPDEIILAALSCRYRTVASVHEL